MADNVYCEACETLKTQDPNLVVNGITDTECNYLQNDDGITGENDDCTDLNTMNDCLIGSMGDEAEISPMCNWREYMEKLATNMWTMNKAFICTICGLWTNVHHLWINVHKIWCNVEKLWCVVDHQGSGIEFRIGEEETDDSYVVAGKGISFLTGGSSQAEVSLTYVAGGLIYAVGSLVFNQNDFTDAAACWNYDNGGANPRKSKNRLGNSLLHNTSGTNVEMVAGGELLYEIRIKKSAYPALDRFFAGSAFPTGGGEYHCQLTWYDEGQEALGQHGRADTRHTVPDGWCYVQCRLVSISHINANGNQYSPRGYMGVRFFTEEISCDGGGTRDAGCQREPDCGWEEC